MAQDVLEAFQATIITDEASQYSNILDLRKYGRKLADIIENSYPGFTTGIVFYKNV